jgi:hypothetical protein
VNKTLTCTIAAAIAASTTFNWNPAPSTALAQGPAAHEFVAPSVFQAAGPTSASIAGTIDAFRLALGGLNNGNVAGPLAEGRREINWDGGGSTATSLVPTPFTGFLNNRGGLFTTPGSGFVQAPVEGLADTFGNPTYVTTFAAFSPVRLFSAIDSNVTIADFFIPGGLGIEANTRGFGVVFSDVDQPDGSGPAGKNGNRKASTRMDYFDENGRLLFTSFVPAAPGNAGFSFFGIVFSDARIAQVKIRAGDADPGGDDRPKRDVVMMDDFIYGEPQIRQ